MTLSRGDLVVYKHAEGWRPAEYLGRHGRKHLIRFRVHGAHGKGLRYVESAAIAEPDLPIDSYTAGHESRPGSQS
jgi:hypothetical protein